MSKYSNTYPSDMEKACDTALAELENKKLDMVIKELDNNMMWESESKKKCVDALRSVNTSSQITGSIVTLKNKLTNLKNVAQKIKKIKSNEDEVRREEKKPEDSRNNAKISRLNSEIKKLEREVDNLLK